MLSPQGAGQSPEKPPCNLGFRRFDRQKRGRDLRRALVCHRLAYCSSDSICCGIELAWDSTEVPACCRICALVIADTSVA